MRVRIPLTLALLVATLPPPVVRAAQPPPREELVDQVRKAIDKAIAYFRDVENGKGHWEEGGAVGVAMRGGQTSLVVLALLNAGVKPNDPVIERGLKYLRDVEPANTYVVALQTMAFAEAGRNEDRQRIQRNVDWLIDARVLSGDKLLGWTYGKSRGGRLTDNSNSQYALLGLHAGHAAGARVDRKVWLEIRDYYIRSKVIDNFDPKSHGWIYSEQLNQGVTLTMTTAGVCSLLIAGLELNEGREQFQMDGSVSNCGAYKENEAIAGGLRWVGHRFNLQSPGNTYYNLYGLERVGRFSGQRFLGEHDWYRSGCEFLVARQRADGSWSEAGGRDGMTAVSSSFALLFLSKGRTPVLVSKLTHGPRDDWNNDRHDARNLVEYASKELFKRQPMAWQVFDPRRVDVGANRARFDELLGALLQSPVVYFNGHEAPEFTDLEQKLIKEYVEQGGFLLAEACCGRENFDKGFRRLMAQLFPDNPLKPLPAEHPIWKAFALVPPNQEFKLEGIEMGCKTVVVYCPQDLSCWWESNKAARGTRGELAFRLGLNLIAYATGMEPPKPRLTKVEVLADALQGQKIPRGYLKIAQVRHEGDWQPAPRAMRNLLAHLREHARLDADLQTQPLRLANPDLMDYKFLYLHGRGTFTFADAELKSLRTHLELGGLLLADACCGKKAFDDSFRTMAQKLFPDKQLERIPPQDDLYSKDLNGATVTSVKIRTKPPGEPGAGELQEMAPQLEGIKLDGRWVVIYSRYDLGCALERHQSPDCLGHDHASALQMGGAAVLYLLKR